MVHGSLNKFDVLRVEVLLLGNQKYFLLRSPRENR